MLLIPEGALRLTGPGPKILERCDGQHTLDEIVRDLEAAYPAAESARIHQEVTAFIQRLREKHVLEL